MLGLGLLGRSLPRLPLVHKGYFDGVARDFLHLGGQRTDLTPVWLVGRVVTWRANRWPSVSTAIGTCEPRRRLAPS
jgi:hypothetical protein